MGFINVEIKAKCKNPDEVEKILRDLHADFVGLDHQIDTYFKVKSGRLKLREGNIENALIFYNRNNQAEPKVSQVMLYETKPNASLKPILEKSIGILTIVDKRRKIFFIGHIKFHIDEVKDLGSFVEIEAIDRKGNSDEVQLRKDCQLMMHKLHIHQNDLESASYSDLLIKQQH